MPARHRSADINRNTVRFTAGEPELTASISPPSPTASFSAMLIWENRLW